jgi:AcrR family transcriptional regulator
MKSGMMTVGKAANKHELKTRETRARLLQAAETIFVRDGYEGADLGEIAALAGRTKGAIYAQFKSKEDIFLALIEERSNCFRAQMEKFLSVSTSAKGNLQALRSFYLQRTEDKAWSLLLLEFKLFALRHPESKSRLQDLRRAFITDNDEQRISGILGLQPGRKDGIRLTSAVEAIFPIISTLVLETQLETALLDQATIKKIVGRVFDALFELPPG